MFTLRTVSYNWSLIYILTTYNIYIPGYNNDYVIINEGLAGSLKMKIIKYLPVLNMPALLTGLVGRCCVGLLHKSVLCSQLQLSGLSKLKQSHKR